MLVVVNMSTKSIVRHNKYLERKNMNTENKNQRFKRLAENRVPNAVKKIQLVTNLADPYAYDYTEEEANKIIRAIKSEVEDMVASFKKGLKKDKSEFKL